jgi:uncharacterized membrane protein YfcA
MTAMTADLTATGIAIFASTAFAAALVAGIAGFAFGLVAAGIWLHLLTPLETATLIVALGALVQGISVWHLRRALDWSRLWPFLLGGMLGVPLGIVVLHEAAPGDLRAAIGALLIIYSLYALLAPRLPSASQASRAADAGIGVASGALGGTTGLSGILPTIWCQLRGWTKDQQRAVFQPVAVAIHLMAMAWLGGAGAVAPRTAVLFALALPATIAGTWLGLKLYAGLGETGFRRIVLTLLLISGVVLLVGNQYR